MPFYFSLMILSEKIDFLLEKVEYESKMLDACGQDKKKERALWEKRIDKTFKELLKRKKGVIKFVDKQKSESIKRKNKLEKKAIKLEKKVDKARKEVEKFEEGLATADKDVKYANEEIGVLKDEILEYIPEKMYEYAFAFVRGSLKIEDNSFEFSVKNIFVDLIFSKADKKNEDIRKATVSDIKLSLDDDVVKDFNIIHKEKSYGKNEIVEGLCIKEGEIVRVKVNRKFKVGMHIALVANTLEYGPITFKKVFKN